MRVYIHTATYNAFMLTLHTDKDMHLQVRQAILKTANINQEILSSSASATSLARWVHISAENLTVLRC